MLAYNGRFHLMLDEPERMPRQALCWTLRRDKYHYSSHISFSYTLKVNYSHHVVTNKFVTLLPFAFQRTEEGVFTHGVTQEFNQE